MDCSIKVGNLTNGGFVERNSSLRRACHVMGNIDVTTFWFKIDAHNKMRFTILRSGMTPKCFSLFILG